MMDSPSRNSCASAGVQSGNNACIVRQRILVCILLALAVFAAFGRTTRYGFVGLDDNEYVYDNAVIKQGLTADGFVRAFTQFHMHNWHPLTTVTNMLDCQLYGLHAGGHHLTNILLHAAAAVFLFLLLQEMTGCIWQSAFVAAVFAVHPLRVESVAWISERKDVLSGLFFMVTLLAYIRWTRNRPSTGRYAWMLLLFAFGLLSKSMLVTVPFLLLVLDFWPLRRLSSLESLPRVLIEKVPLCILSAAFCLATVRAQEKGLEVAEKMALPVRLGNMLVSYVIYLGQTILPARLAVLYPLQPNGHEFLTVLVAFLLLTAISVAAWRCRKRQPWMLAGWLWYAGMMVPVSGIVQVGAQAHADRFTYLPQIGIFIALTWSVSEWIAPWKYKKTFAAGMASAVIAGLMACSYIQCGYWENTFRLWTHTLEVTKNNPLAHYNLGTAYFQNGEQDKAVDQWKEALKIRPGFAEAEYNLGTVSLARGDLDGAISRFTRTIEIKPDYLDAYNNIGAALLKKGLPGTAVELYSKAIKIDPRKAGLRNNLGAALLQAGQEEEAMAQWRMALEIQPDFAAAAFNLGNALLQAKHSGEAVAQYEKVIQIQPDHDACLNCLSWVLATSPDASLRNGPRAVLLAQKANRLTGGTRADYLRTLSAAYAETGRYAEAVDTAWEALRLAGPESNSEMIQALYRDIKFYEAGTPVRAGD